MSGVPSRGINYRLEALCPHIIRLIKGIRYYFAKNIKVRLIGFTTSSRKHPPNVKIPGKYCDFSHPDKKNGQAANPRVGWGTHEDETAAMTGFQQRNHYAKLSFREHDRSMTFWSSIKSQFPTLPGLKCPLAGSASFRVESFSLDRAARVAELADALDSGSSE